MPRYDVVTFDCYGTLIDWESGIARAFAGADRAAVIDAYGRHEPAVEAEVYRPYRDILRETARRVAGELGCDPPDLVASLPSWQPFADTNGALQRLRAAGLRLAILSNVDDDLLAATRRHFATDFDFVVTAQQVRSYKPGRAHFDAARQRIGDARWLHAAASNFHDVVPANALGIDTAWINRGRWPQLPGGAPLYELRDLGGLADTIV